jgi:hypothetical protein
MTWGALQNPHLLPGMFELPLFYVFLIGMLALTGYYITGYSFYYGMICFQRELTGFIAPKGKARAILAIVKSYSRGLQILLFTFAGLLNQLLLGLLLFAVWSNLVWVGRLVKYSKNYRKKQ